MFDISHLFSPAILYPPLWPPALPIGGARMPRPCNHPPAFPHLPHSTPFHFSSFTYSIFFTVEILIPYYNLNFISLKY